MKRLSLYFQMLAQSPGLNRRRMILTMSAIAWGTVAILLLLSFGEGLKNALTEGRSGLGDAINIVWNGETQRPHAGFPTGRPIRMEPEDVQLLLDNVPEIASATGEMRTWAAQLTWGGQTLNKRITGVEVAYAELRNQRPRPGGRFLDPIDVAKRRRVIFLGNEIADGLFGDQDPVGETIRVNRVPFLVVGVLADKMQMGTYGGPDAQNSLIPLTTFEAVFGGRKLSNLVFKARSTEVHERAQERFYEVMAAKYRFHPEDERALPIWDTLEGQKITDKISLGLEIFLGVVGALTLLVGGVGVANIMAATVRHRTPEFGIKMALGARPRWILVPLVLESLALTAAGGAIGVLVGATLIQLLAWVQSNAQSEAMKFLGQPTISLPIALITVGILGSIGWAAGYFPARRALRVDPATVLRHD